MLRLSQTEGLYLRSMAGIHRLFWVRRVCKVPPHHPQKRSLYCLEFLLPRDKILLILSVKQYRGPCLGCLAPVFSRRCQTFHAL